MRNRFAVFGFGIVVVVGFIAFLGWGLSNKTSVTGLSGATRVGKPAPEFTAQSFDGETIQISGLQGRPVVLNFWSSTCPPCREEARLLESASRDYGDDGVEFLGVNIQDFDGPAREFLEEFGVTYPNVPDRSGAVTIDYGVVGLPVTFFINAEGVVVGRWVGAIKNDRLRTAIDDLLDGESSTDDLQGSNDSEYYTFEEL